MWFLFQQPDEFLDRFNAERRRAERIAQLTRALRGATPPFDATLQRQLQQAMSRARAVVHQEHQQSREASGSGRLAEGRS
jgi:hypothetical protein